MKLHEIIEPKLSLKIVDPLNIFDDVVHGIYDEILHSCNYLNRQLLYRWIESHMNISLDCDDIDVSANIIELYGFFDMMVSLIKKRQETIGATSINIGNSMIQIVATELNNIQNWKSPKISYKE